MSAALGAPQGGGLHRLRRLPGPDGPLLRREWNPAAAQVLGADFEAEVTAQRLAAEQGLAPPVLEVDFEAGWVLMPWIEGRTLESDWPQRKERRAVLHSLLARLRSVRAPSLAPLDLAARAALLQRRLAERAPDAAAAFEPEVAAACDAWAASVGAQRTCLVHGDLTPGNVLVRPDGAMLLLDWEYAHAGGPWDDLAALVAAEPSSPPEWAAQLPSADRVGFSATLRLRRLLDALWHALRAGVPDSP